MLSVGVGAGASLPAEFLVFKAGVNATSKGDFVFDAASARSVIANWRAQGNELMLDYDHASLSAWPVDPALSARAAGWFALEMRGADLWAVNVRWTPQASTALANKEWRYFSPAFETDEHGRITALVNIALTNLPATKSMQPLVAASKGHPMLDAETIKAALDALEAGDGAAATEILKQLIAEAASGGASDAASEEPADGAESEAPTASQDAALVAAGRMAMTLTGAPNAGAAVEQLTRIVQAAKDLEAREEQLAADRAALEADERRGLVVQLIKLGAETPATAWTGEDAKTVCKRLADEPIAGMRARVKTLSATARKPKTPPPSSENGVDANGLTPDEARICAATKCDPKVFLSLKKRAR
jgi:phage I-like protein